MIYATPNNRERIEKNMSIITGLAKCETIEFFAQKDDAEDKQYAYGQAGDVDVYVDTSGFSNDDEIERLKKIIEEKEDYLRSLEVKLTDTSFISNAPQKVIRLTQEKKDVTVRQLEKAKEQLAKITG